MIIGHWALVIFLRMKRRLRDFVRSLPRLPRGLTLGFVAALALLSGLAWLRADNLARRRESVDAALRQAGINAALKDYVAAVRDAESGQRGYLLTGNRVYLAPYEEAQAMVPRNLERLQVLAGRDPQLKRSVSVLAGLADDKMVELRDTVALADAGRRDEALARVRTGEGEALMENIRAESDAFAAREDDRATARRVSLERRRRLGRVLDPTVTVVALGLAVGTFVSLLRQFGRTQRAEAGLRANQEKLERANEELKSFAYSVAHDLRAPLRAINGFAGVLVEDHGPALDTEARQALERITANGTRMSRLIDDLLALSRVSTLDVQPRRIEMASMVREVCEELVGNDRSAVELTLPTDLPLAAGDPSLIRQVWVNLVANALKFSRDRSPARIEIGGLTAGADFVTYFVRDNGAGFDMKYLGKLFGPFQRLHRADEFEGTGIGLALVKRIVQRHGGAVWAESSEGQGALFAFTLPEWVGSAT